MTKEKIIDLLRNKLSENRPQADDMIRLAEGKLSAYLTLAYQHMVFNITRYNPSSYTSLLADYTYTLQNISTKKAGNVTVLDTSYQPMSVANQEGVRSVFPSGQPEHALVYRNINADWMMPSITSALGVTTINGTYSVDAKQIVVRPTVESEFYDLRIIPEFDSIGDEDNVKLPMGGEVSLVEVARAMYMGDYRKDVINDSV